MPNALKLPKLSKIIKFKGVWGGLEARNCFQGQWFTKSLRQTLVFMFSFNNTVQETFIYYRVASQIWNWNSRIFQGIFLYIPGFISYKLRDFPGQESISRFFLQSKFTHIIYTNLFPTIGTLSCIIIFLPDPLLVFLICEPAILKFALVLMLFTHLFLFYRKIKQF